MSELKNWYKSASGNVSYFKEYEMPSHVNDQMRSNLGSIKEWHDSAEWIDLGHTPSYVSAASLSINGNHKSEYHAGRRIKVIDSSTLYGYISSSTYTTNSTGVYVSLDSGNLTTSLSSISVGTISYENKSINTNTTTSIFSNSSGYVVSASNVYASNYVGITHDYTATSFNDSNVHYLAIRKLAKPGDVFVVQATAQGMLFAAAPYVAMSVNVGITVPQNTATNTVSCSFFNVSRNPSNSHYVYNEKVESQRNDIRTTNVIDFIKIKAIDSGSYSMSKTVIFSVGAISYWQSMSDTTIIRLGIARINS